jgi:hypothetical protein
MSRKADDYDKAPMVSFFQSLKTELVHRRGYATRQDATLVSLPASKASPSNASSRSATSARSRWSQSCFTRSIIRNKIDNGCPTLSIAYLSSQSVLPLARA